MSATGRIRRVRDRPIAEHERRTAMAGVTVLLAAAGLLLSISQPATSKGQATLNKRPAGAATERATRRITRQADQAAYRFLTGYLSYVYGHSTATRIVGATPTLIRALAAQPPRVSPAARARHPRVLALHPTPTSTARAVVTATVNDGGLIDYPVTLTLTAKHGRLLVTGLEGTR